MTCAFSIVVFATYEADLTTRMTVQEQESPFRSFSDIAQSNRHCVVVFAGGSDYQILKGADPNSALGQIYQQVSSDKEKFIIKPTDCPLACRINLFSSQLVRNIIV